jgi:hypothetical protein
MRIAATIINETAKGLINLNVCKASEGKPEYKKESNVIIINDGKIHTKRVKKPRNEPPYLYPKVVRVCVEDGPGSIWQME